MQDILQTFLLTLLGISLRAFGTQSNPTCAFCTQSKAAMNSDLQLAMKQLAAERQSQDAIPAHYALQQQWFENRASRKRAAPTPQETPIGTPHPEAVDETMEPPPGPSYSASFQWSLWRDNLALQGLGCEASILRQFWWHIRDPFILGPHIASTQQAHPVFSLITAIPTQVHHCE